MNKEQIIEAIESMTVLELSELVKALERKISAYPLLLLLLQLLLQAAGGAAAAEEKN